ncbi:MAG: hypothetical protein EHM83_09980 [Burkholderiales bacterium]|nr:MAG: hypothetical protein EHM83_09980 [Burkholderiales bacterium]
MQAHRLLNASVTMRPGGASQAGAVSGWRARLRCWPEFGGPAPNCYPRGGGGWSTQPGRRTELGFVRLLVNLEQAPHPDNRVVLTGLRDRLGVPRAQVHWQWRADEQARLEQLRALLARELEGAGFGRVRQTAQAMPDPRAHHHAGTTRMHEDPRSGAVDRDCRVHGIENLFAAGASVFPTAGFANPTLTIVALALRLADRLRAG